METRGGAGGGGGRGEGGAEQQLVGTGEVGGGENFLVASELVLVCLCFELLISEPYVVECMPLLVVIYVPKSPNLLSYDA